MYAVIIALLCLTLLSLCMSVWRALESLFYCFYCTAYNKTFELWTLKHASDREIIICYYQVNCSKHNIHTRLSFVLVYGV